MKKEENVEIKPLFEGMTYTDESWLVINTRDNKKPEVIFYTKSQDNEENFIDIKEFASFIFEDKFVIPSKSTNIEEDITDTKCTKSGCLVTEEDDCNEESRKSFKVLVAKTQMIDIYQKIELKNIPDLISAAKKDLARLEENELESFSETKEYQKDPHSYYGVSKSDFF